MCSPRLVQCRLRRRGNVERVKLGVFGLNCKATINPAATARLAKRCEDLGYDSWWAGEHVVLPSPRVPPAPMEPTDAILDPLVHLAFVAALTELVTDITHQCCQQVIQCDEAHGRIIRMSDHREMRRSAAEPAE